MLTYALSLYRGDTARRQFRLWADAARTVPVDLTDVAVAAEVRRAPGTTPIVPLDLTVTLPNLIDLELPAATTAALPPAGEWDLQLTWPSGDVQTVVRGAVRVTADVTASGLAGARRG